MTKTGLYNNFPLNLLLKIIILEFPLVHFLQSNNIITDLLLGSIDVAKLAPSHLPKNLKIPYLPLFMARTPV